MNSNVWLKLQNYGNTWNSSEQLVCGTHKRVWEILYSYWACITLFGGRGENPRDKERGRNRLLRRFISPHIPCHIAFPRQEFHFFIFLVSGTDFSAFTCREKPSLYKGACFPYHRTWDYFWIVWNYPKVGIRELVNHLVVSWERFISTGLSSGNQAFRSSATFRKRESGTNAYFPVDPISIIERPSVQSDSGGHLVFHHRQIPTLLGILLVTPRKDVLRRIKASNTPSKSNCFARWPCRLWEESLLCNVEIRVFLSIIKKRMQFLSLLGCIRFRFGSSSIVGIGLNIRQAWSYPGYNNSWASFRFAWELGEPFGSATVVASR